MKCKTYEVTQFRHLFVLVIAVVFFACRVPAAKAFPPVPLNDDQQEELNSIRNDLKGVSSQIKRKNYDEAEQSINDVEERLKKLIKQANLPEDDLRVAPVLKLVSLRKQSLEMARDPKAARKKMQDRNLVSFTKHIAPILANNCISCHGELPKGELRLDSYAGMKEGGTSGPLLAVGNPKRSLIIGRLICPDPKLRMPPKGELTKQEVYILAMWIAQGAKCDAESEKTLVTKLIEKEPMLLPIEVPRADGSETVSFCKQIAPLLNRYCVRCHNEDKAEGGLRMDNIEWLWRGGKNGPALRAGDPVASRMIRLMTGQVPDFMMPYGTRGLEEENIDLIKKWIEEGATYDHEDTKLSFRVLNPTGEQMLSSEADNLDDKQMVEFRTKRSLEQWKKAFPDAEPVQVENDQFLFLGNVTKERLEEASRWTDQYLKSLRKLLDLPEEKILWRGRLAIFVVASREDFENFSQKILERKAFDDVHGNFLMTDSSVDALVVAEDTGEVTNETQPSLQFSLLNFITRAYLRQEKDVFYPQWFEWGLGYALASAETGTRDQYAKALRTKAGESLIGLDEPADVFQDGTFFSEEEATPVAMTLVEYLIKTGGHVRFRKLVKLLAEGGNNTTIFGSVYGAAPENIAKAYVAKYQVKKTKR